MLIKRFTIYLFAALILLSCSEFNKVQKKGTLDDKLNAAYKYYDKKDYYKATMLFDEVVPLVIGKLEGEKALFYYAYTFYHQKQYIMAAYYFRDFFETYPRSEFNEESMFMYAKSLYKDSPEYNLDQTNTYDAIRAIQRFTNKYPASKYMEEANMMMDEANAKLERKDFETARLYYKLGAFNSSDYKSAVINLDKFLIKYPASKYAEEASFLRLDAQYNLAKHSEHHKQKERYFDAIEFYHNFVDKFPNSKYKKEAEGIYDSCIKKLEEIKS
ncbi:MAG: outer membrane protein assembly factor BamD [Cytophagaceae bacterium]|nr:outer membrane protein assembly factor BamD [Cytophagaceae bacterium]